MSVLLCDDEDMFVEALAAALRHMEHDIVETTTDPDAIAELAQRHHPAACIVDLRFNGQVREELADDIRQASPGTAILLLTGIAGPAAWRLYDDGLVDGLAGKSSSLDVLDSTLREVLAGRRVAAGVNRPALPTDHPGQLTERETQVLRLLVTGASTKEIGQALHIGQATARSHVQHLLQKRGAHTRVGVVLDALAEGIVGSP